MFEHLNLAESHHPQPLFCTQIINVREFRTILTFICYVIKAQGWFCYEVKKKIPVLDLK